MDFEIVDPNAADESKEEESDPESRPSEDVADKQVDATIIGEFDSGISINTNFDPSTLNWEE